MNLLGGNSYKNCGDRQFSYNTCQHGRYLSSKTTQRMEVDMTTSQGMW